MNDKKSIFYSYSCTLILDNVCVFIAMFRWNVCKQRSAEKLLTSVSAITLNSRRHDLMSIESYVDQSRRLFIRDVA